VRPEGRTHGLVSSEKPENAPRLLPLYTGDPSTRGMSTEATEFFDRSFLALTGNTSYPWQRQLFRGMAGGSWPEVVPLPTGSGKTSVLHVWLLALAWSLRTGSNSVPRRLAWVVDRRVVVDQVTKEAEELVANGLEAWPEVKNLAISTLRGQKADNGEWASDPSRPAVVVGTVDMIGSRLLFRGYRSGGYHRPIHAGLLGVDTLIVNDESHLTPAFEKLLTDIYRRAPAACIPGKTFRVMMLSATSAKNGLKVFGHSLADDLAESGHFSKVFDAPKSLGLHPVEGRAVEATLRQLAAENPAPRTVVFIESPEKAAAFAKSLGREDSTVLLTGTMRGFERDKLANDPLFKKFLDEDAPEEPVWLVATSAAEVGVNLTCERLVTGLVEADHLIQRFGRLNRFGTAPGEAYVVFAPPKDERLTKTLEYLYSLNRDVCCRNIWEHQPPDDARSEKPSCARLEKRLIEMWAQTTYKDSAMPRVEPWLRGKQSGPPETELAWRADIPFLTGWGLDAEDIQEVLERYPIRPHERLQEPAERVLKKLQELAEKMGEEGPKTKLLSVASDGSVRVVEISQLRRGPGGTSQEDIEYKLLILPDTFGTLDRGMFRPDVPPEEKRYDVADEGESPRRRYLIQSGSWKPIGRADDWPLPSDSGRETLARFAREHGLRAPYLTRHPEEDWVLAYFVEAPKSRRPPEDVLLSVHQEAVAEKAKELAQRAGLGGFAPQFEGAGAIHDGGKAREIWRRAFTGKTEGPALAKSKAPGNMRLLDGYRHELGSLVDAGDERDDLVLHLIASHHKAGRPYFSEKQLDRDNVSQSQALALEAARRFARLQNAYGPWGLAYLEAIFKIADGLASDDEGGAISG
jgi:CRISPR-associated endonuclease/helicase Cas3